LRADFYHLAATTLERALPGIAEKVIASGARLAVVADEEALLNQLDTTLWTYRADSFLPHGREGDQPVLLCAPGAVPPGYAHIALADGVWRDSALDHERAFYFFDESSITGAREAWKALKDRDGVERHYWKQDEEGRWKDMA
jgi:DNA polymerase-3 subunit chi